MMNVDLPGIIRDVESGLREHQNGFKLHVDRDRSYASDVTVYVLVVVDDYGGKSPLELVRVFEQVEQQVTERHRADVLVLPAAPMMG